MMLRIKSDKLVYTNKLMHFKGVPFSGASFTLDGCRVTKKIIYRDGIAVGEYVNEIIAQRYSNYLEIDDDCIEFDPKYEYTSDSPAHYQDKLFTGVSYVFKDEYCTGECFYLNGSDTNGYIEMYWNIYGELKHIEVYDKDQLFQKFIRYNNPRMDIKEMEIASNDYTFTPLFKMRTREAGILSTLSISDEYFNTVPQIRDQLYFEPIKNKTYFKEMRVEEDAFLFQSGIDDEIFDYLFNPEKIMNLKLLLMRHTSVSISKIEKVLQAGILEKLNIEDKRYDIATFRRLKQQYPHVEIIFDNKEVL